MYERVYHFVEAKWAVDDLEKRRLKICRYLDLNDPFELRAGGMADKALRTKMRRWAEVLHDRYGILCFTASWKNALMWSIYGDRHEGVCLGFDVEDSIVKRVKYSRRRLQAGRWNQISSADPPPQISESLLATKFDGWRFEDERRVIEQLSCLEMDEQHYYRKFDQTLKLAEVIAGHRCPEEWRPKLQSAVARLPESPRLIKARLAFTKFKVVEQELGFGHPRAWLSK